MVSGLFFGFAFGMGGIGAALLGKLADAQGIEFVYQVCAFLPAIGLLTAFLPSVEGLQHRRQASQYHSHRTVEIALLFSPRRSYFVVAAHTDGVASRITRDPRAQTALDMARAARDSAGTGTLRARVAEARKGTSLADLLLTARLDGWLCEALYAPATRQEVKRAVQAGVEAAERAVRSGAGIGRGFHIACLANCWDN